MADLFRFDAGWHFDDPRVKFDTVAPTQPPTPPPMSEDNQISAEITAANLATIQQKLDEIEALLPTIPDISDAALKRLLGIDASTEVDDIAAEALAAHPEWKPFVVDATEFPKDRALFADSAPLEMKTEALARKVVIIRRLAGHDTRRASLAIYHQVAELAARGNVEAKSYYDQMSPFFPGRPKAPKPPKPPKP